MELIMYALVKTVMNNQLLKKYLLYGVRRARYRNTGVHKTRGTGKKLERKKRRGRRLMRYRKKRRGRNRDR
jgi:hypothetical protein